MVSFCTVISSSYNFIQSVILFVWLSRHNNCFDWTCLKLTLRNFLFFTWSLITWWLITATPEVCCCTSGRSGRCRDHMQSSWRCQTPGWKHFIFAFSLKATKTHPCRHPGVTDGAVDLVTGGAPAEPGQDHDPADDVRHRRAQREDHLQHHECERQLHLFTHT